MVQRVLHPQVNDNIYPAHDREKKGRKELGKFSAPSLQSLLSKHTVEILFPLA